MNQEKSQKKNQWVRGAGRLEKGVFQSQEAWSLKEKTTWISVLLVLGAHSARTVILYDRSNACTVSQPITGFSTQTGHDKRAPPEEPRRDVLVTSIFRRWIIHFTYRVQFLFERRGNS